MLCVAFSAISKSGAVRVVYGNEPVNVVEFGLPGHRSVFARFAETRESGGSMWLWPGYGRFAPYAGAGFVPRFRS